MIHVHRRPDPPDREVIGVFYNSQLLVELDVNISKTGNVWVTIRDGVGDQVDRIYDVIEEAE